MHVNKCRDNAEVCASEILAYGCYFAAIVCGAVQIVCVVGAYAYFGEFRAQGGKGGSGALADADGKGDAVNGDYCAFFAVGGNFYVYYLIPFCFCNICNICNNYF